MGSTTSASSTDSASSTTPAASCVPDKLFNLFKSNRYESFSFCRKLLAHPVHVVDAVTTVTPTAATYLSTHVVTSTVVVSTTTLETSTTVTTSFTTTTVSTATITATSTRIIDTLFRRTDSPFATAIIGVYNPEALSSACSCLKVPQCGRKKTTATSTRTSTTTLAASTFTSLATSTQLTSSTTTIRTTTIATSTTVHVESATATTTTTVPPAPTTTQFRIEVTMPDGSTNYVKSTPFGGNVPWDLVYHSAGSVGAVPFTLDANKHVSMGSISQGSTVWPGHESFWMSTGDPNTSYWFAFLTTANNAAFGNRLLYTFQIDTANNNKLRIFRADGTELRFETCNHGGNPAFAVALPNAVTLCTPINVKAVILS